MTDSPAQDDPLDEAFAAYLRSCDAGEVTSREDFLSQFPDLSDQLRELMEAADMIGRVTRGDRRLGSVTSPGAETVALNEPISDDSSGDPAATLPMAHRAKGDPGPTLPFQLGDYQLLQIIGRGGMGVVYLAKQRHLDRMVAVKMIRSGMLADEAEVKRFYTEAQAAARLHHSGIVGVHQFGHSAGHHFFSMEFVRGTDLQRRIDQGVLDPQQAARYVRDVAWAIDHAHQNGVLHRDLKPANVLIDEDDQVHVTDFGLAKHLDADSSVTGSGAAIGTPHYMAPEQAGGYSDRANHHSDIYSLGAILFACLAGRPPIVGDTVMQTLIQVVHRPAPPLRSVRCDAPMDLETIAAKCLEKDPHKRYPSAAKLAHDLDAYLAGRPISARPRGRILRVWHWIEGVPVVGALTGRRVLETSIEHRRVQTVLLCLLILTPFLLIGSVSLWQHVREAMPSQVRIAGGLDGGVYNAFSSQLATRLRAAHPIETVVVPSSGSDDNRHRLLAGQVHLAPMQASAIRGDVICVVAPLFYEAVHLLVRNDSGVKTVGDLRGHRVAVGPQGSGSRVAAELVFESLQLTPDVAPRQVIAWSQLNSNSSIDVAVICSGRGSRLVNELLASQRWRLLSIPTAIQIALRHPALRPMTISASEYPGAELPAEGIATIGTTAFLAARRDAPSALITAALEALYSAPPAYPPPAVSEPSLAVELIPKERAVEWQGLRFHPAARSYYAESL